MFNIFNFLTYSNNSFFSYYFSSQQFMVPSMVFPLLTLAEKEAAVKLKREAAKTSSALPVRLGAGPVGGGGGGGLDRGGVSYNPHTQPKTSSKTAPWNSHELVLQVRSVEKKSLLDDSKVHENSCVLKIQKNQPKGSSCCIIIPFALIDSAIEGLTKMKPYFKELDMKLKIHARVEEQKKLNELNEKDLA
jgi:hypothetical protein